MTTPAETVSPAMNGSSSSTALPYGLAMRFNVTIDRIDDKIDLGDWSACKGLKVELKVTRVTSGGDYSTEWILPDRISYSNITLERAVHPDDSETVLKWLQDVSSQWMDWDGSNPAYLGKTATITLLGVSGQKVMSWNLTGVYPVSWSGPSLSATDNKVAIETLELAHQGFLKSSTGVSSS
jgi:phage tail-like protein